MSFPTLDPRFELPPDLFLKSYEGGTLTLLDNLIAALRSEKQIFAVLPRDVSASEFACYFCLKLLPNAMAPPTPHCRVTLCPGRGFIRDLTQVSLNPEVLNALFARARVAGKFKRLTAPANRIRKRLNAGISDPVLFHWIWRCDVVRDDYGQPNRYVFGPRDHYGRGDVYESTIDLIDARAETAWDAEYDLAVFCPFYNPVAFNEWQDAAGAMAGLIKRFPAALKLIVVRSSLDHWARKLEEQLPGPGLVCSAPAVVEMASAALKPIRIEVVEQCLTADESRTLHDALRKISPGTNLAATNALRDIHSYLRRILVGLGRWEKEEGSIASEELAAAFEAMGLSNNAILAPIIQKLLDYPRRSEAPEKLERIAQLAIPGKTIVWAVRDRDRKALQDFFVARRLAIEVRLTDRRMQFLQRDQGCCRILTRVDRESHLDWVSHLRAGDVAIISAWESTILEPVIIKYWERSEKWRMDGIAAGVAPGPKRGGSSQDDPVLDLATTVLRKAEPEVQGAKDTGSETFWWDELYRGHSFEPEFGRNEALSSVGGVACVEIRFDDSTGIFLRENGDVQILREHESGDVDLMTVPATESECGDVIVLPKDEERGSILDIIMKYLSSSPKYGADARVLTEWKDNLRAAFEASNESISSLKSRLEQAGGHCDQVTVRTWIFGTTMAPRDTENTKALIDVLNIAAPPLSQLLSSVGRLRGIPRMIGRMLSQFVTEQDLKTKQRRELETLIVEAGITPEAIRSAVEMRRINWKSDYTILVSPSYVRRLFQP